MSPHIVWTVIVWIIVCFTVGTQRSNGEEKARNPLPAELVFPERKLPGPTNMLVKSLDDGRLTIDVEVEAINVRPVLQVIAIASTSPEFEQVILDANSTAEREAVIGHLLFRALGKAAISGCQVSVKARPGITKLQYYGVRIRQLEFTHRNDYSNPTAALALRRPFDARRTLSHDLR